MDIERGIESEKQGIDIHPLKKGKRILVFLADFFLCFIITFVLFNAASLPIGKAISGYNNKYSHYLETGEEMYEHYYKNNIVLKGADFEKDDMTSALEFTYGAWLSYYVLENEETIDPNHKEYGHRLENEVAFHYYRDLRNDKDTYRSLFNKYNTNGYFTIDDDLAVYDFVLQNEYKTALYSYFDPKDEMGTDAQKVFDGIRDNLYAPLMAEVMKDIEVNDLHFEGETYSYLGCKKVLNDYLKYLKNLMTICTFISHFITWLGYFLIFPLINRSRKTPAMLMMKVERVNFFNLNHISPPLYLISAFYSLFSTMILIMFIPVLMVEFSTLFTYTYLIFGTIVSSLLAFASMIFLFINQYNRSLTDYLCTSLYLTESEMDEIYRARGYNV